MIRYVHHSGLGCRGFRHLHVATEIHCWSIAAHATHFAHPAAARGDFLWAKAGKRGERSPDGHQKHQNVAADFAHGDHIKPDDASSVARETIRDSDGCHT